MRRVLLALEPPDGGVAVNVAQLAAGLGEHGWEAEVAGPPESVIYPRLQAAGIRVHRLPLARDYGDPRREIAVLRRLTRLIRRGSYDLVHCHSAKVGVLGRLAAARARVPAVYSPHALPFVGPFGFKRRAGARAIERALAPLSAAILCVSEDERREAAAAGLGGDDRLCVVHNGCEACDASIPADPDLAAFACGGRVVGAVAVLRRQKRLDLLLDATPEILRRVPDARVVIVGNGPLAETLRAQAVRLGLDEDPRFRLLPFEPPSARYLRALDVFALPSDWEGLPIALLEALACGVPQVASNVGGVSEAVSERTGRLVEPGDAAALAQAVVAVLEDEEARRRMAAASVERHREAFGLARMVAGTSDVYAGALARRSSSGLPVS